MDTQKHINDVAPIVDIKLAEASIANENKTLRAKLGAATLEISNLKKTVSRLKVEVRDRERQLRADPKYMSHKRAADISKSNTELQAGIKKAKAICVRHNQEKEFYKKRIIEIWGVEGYAKVCNHHDAPFVRAANINEILAKKDPFVAPLPLDHQA